MEKKRTTSKSQKNELSAHLEKVVNLALPVKPIPGEMKTKANTTSEVKTNDNSKTENKD